MPKRLPELTAARLSRLKPRDRQYEVRDGAVPGLVIRVQPSGVLRWGFRARQDGRLRYILIGGHPELSLAAARIRARALRARLDAGERPADERAERRGEPTLGELWQDYKKRHRKAERSATEDERRWARQLKRWESKIASSIPRRDVARLMHRIAEQSGPYEANRTLALLRHLYRWAIDQELIDGDNPAWGLRREPEAPRERALTATETRKLLEAVAAEPDPLWQGYFLLLLLTGCRRTELLSARWQWFRPDHVPPVLVLPRTATKQKREHVVVLSSEALQVLLQLPSRATSAFLFPSDKGGPRTEPKRVWQEVRTRAGLGDLRIHDLRHAVGSSLGDARESAFIIKRALGHSQLATTDRYVHPELEATHRALEAHGAKLRALRSNNENNESEQRATVPPATTVDVTPDE
ncbi:MAG: tyrosine-type recombinase/integrase [Thermodesulfobacteriota bacterium]